MSQKFLAILLASSMTASAFAQAATEAQKAGVGPGNHGTMHFRTKLGSFKVINGEGRVEFTFTGTVLVSNLDGKLEVTGNVRKEYEAHKRVIYTGTGRCVVTGKWRAVQWFGRDMSAVWFGSGVIRLSGEFDRDQKTGEYWYEDPSQVDFWPGNNTIDAVNPKAVAGYNPNVTVKKKKG
ncbi:MAG: hypothetical protein JSS66_03015 [Armatimonadetes bacterium]|nr:hypothetical protein [Armatimonadota bacterium]